MSEFDSSYSYFYGTFTSLAHICLKLPTAVGFMGFRINVISVALQRGKVVFLS